MVTSSFFLPILDNITAMCCSTCLAGLLLLTLLTCIDWKFSGRKAGCSNLKELIYFFFLILINHNSLGKWISATGCNNLTDKQIDIYYIFTHNISCSNTKCLLTSLPIWSSTPQNLWFVCTYEHLLGCSFEPCLHLLTFERVEAQCWRADLKYVLCDYFQQHS